MRIKTIFFLLPVMLMCYGHVQARDKYAVGLFHFNLQYVAGDYKIERRIIRESLLPVLQFFDQHPKYRSDIEIQGYGIEVLAQEHPDVLALLKKLVARGQIELVMAHYSDQLFIGYPALDLQRSVELCDEVLAKYGLKRSRVFFGQEMQWSPAMATALKGKYDIVATSGDPNSWYLGETLPLVNVRYGGDSILALLSGGRKNLQGMDWGIAFLDDGEEFNTLDYNSDFFREPKQEKANKDKYRKLEEEGYRFVTITELAARIKTDAGYTIPAYPFVPEGTWHMKICGPFMWLGRQRSGVETDGITRAACYQARGEVMMVETMLAYAEKEGKDVSALRVWLKEAWKHLLLSEVSDSSGWDPWLVEVQYTDNEVATTRKYLKMILEQLWKLIGGVGKRWEVNTGTGIVRDVSGSAGGFAVDSVAAALPVNFSVLAKSYSVGVVLCSDSVYRVDIECARPANGAVEISFETAASGLEYSAAGGEGLSVEVPLKYLHDPAFSLANGYVYLGNGYSLVKDCSVEHLAATWKRDARSLVFREELREGNETMHMRLYVVKGGPASGLRLGNAINTWPGFRVEGTSSGFSFQKIEP